MTIVKETTKNLMLQLECYILFLKSGLADSEAVRKLFSVQKNVTTRQAPLLVWVSASNGQVPPNSVSAGSDFYGAPLYVARILLPSGFTPGKLSPSNGGAYASYGGLEIFQSTYEVLTNPSNRALKWLSLSASPPDGGLVHGRNRHRCWQLVRCKSSPSGRDDCPRKGCIQVWSVLLAIWRTGRGLF